MNPSQNLKAYHHSMLVEQLTNLALPKVQFSRPFQSLLKQKKKAETVRFEIPKHY